MKKSVLITVVFLALALMLPTFAGAQNSIKLRLSGSYPFSFKESGGDEKLNPTHEALLEDRGPFSDFSNSAKLGFNAEAMLSLSERFWIGAEFGMWGLTGTNDNPTLYNLQYNDFNQLWYTVKDMELPAFPISPGASNGLIGKPLEYSTSLMDILASARFYVLPSGKIRPFVKAHIGVSLISTELSYRDKSSWPPDGFVIVVGEENYYGEDLLFSDPVLYSAGKNGSKRETALNFGGGIGFEIMLTEKISLYVDGAYSMIMSDILDGRPGFDFYQTVDEEGTVLTSGYDRKKVDAGLLKVNFGICYTFGDFNLFGGNGSVGGTYGNSKNPYLPFSPPKKR